MALPVKIFIVENHQDTLASLKLYFEDLGHEVKSATTIAEAMEVLPPAAPDLLFCDIGLPDGMGWELLRKLQLTRPLFAVAMSGFGMNADSARSREEGFRHHLLKPFKIAELNRILAEADLEMCHAGQKLP
jgi:CheY-like chemotaxis protein